MKTVPLKKPTYKVCELIPSVSHGNKDVKTLVDHFATVFDTDQLFTKQKEVIGLEIYGDKERISYHFIIPEAYGSIIIPKIKHTFKGSSLLEGDLSSILFNPSTETFGSESNRARFHLVNILLKNQAFLPLNMNEKASIFQDIIHTLDHLQSGEKVWIQMLFQPIHDEWQHGFREAYQNWLAGGQSMKGMGLRDITQMMVKGLLDALQSLIGHMIQIHDKTLDKRPAIKEVNTKLTQAGFKSCIRVCVNAEEYRKRNIARGITAAFRTLSHENDFVTRTPIFKERMRKQMEERQMPKIIVNHQVLCSSEVANLMKMPDEQIDTPKLKRMNPEERQVDPSVTKSGLLIGHTMKKEPVHFSIAHYDDIARHRLFIASPGGGKSTLIEQFVHEAAKQRHGCAIFDTADGRLYERIIAMNPEFKDRIVCVDYTDRNHPPAFNFSTLGEDDETRGLMFGEFFEHIFKTEDLARTQNYMLKAALSVFVDKDATILEFIEMLRNEEFRKNILPMLKLTKPDLYLWWVREFIKIGEKRWNEIISPILVRLDMLLYNHRMRNILCQKGGRMNPAKWMQEGKIVVFNLSGGSFTEAEQRMLMSLHNSAFWNATLARENLTKINQEPRPFHLIYDEPQTYMGATPMFDRALSKARKYRVSCNFFIQEAEQIIKEAPDLWKKILGMSPHIMIGAVGEFTAKQVSKELDMKVEDILAIKKHKYAWILKTYHNKEAIEPFIIKTMPPRDEREECKSMNFTMHVDKVKRESRDVFCTMNIKLLNKEIDARSMGMTTEEYDQALELGDEIEEAGFKW